MSDMRSITTIILAGVFGLSTTAYAGDTCPESIPANLDPDSSDSCKDVCFVVADGTTFREVCDLKVNGEDDTADAWIKIVYDHDGNLCDKGGSDWEYCAWGEDGNGSDFFCEWDGQDASSRDLIEVRAVGTDLADGLYFQHDQSTTEYDLDSWSASVSVTGYQIANAGNDVQIGSRTDNPGLYADLLHGNDGADTQCGYDGADTLEGDAHADIQCGMLGNDSLYGGSSNDYLDYGSGSGQSNDGGPGSDDQCNMTNLTCEDTLRDDHCEAE